MNGSFEVEDFISKGHFHSAECESCGKFSYLAVCQFIMDLKKAKNDDSIVTTDEIIQTVVDAWGIEEADLVERVE